MKILVISHTYITPINRTKWLVFAKKYPTATITVLVPTHWKTSFFNLLSDKLRETSIKNCTFTALPTFFAGNELLYFYRPWRFLQLLRAIKPDVIHVEQGMHALSYFQTLISNKILNLKAHCSFFTWINWEPPRSFLMNLFIKIFGFINSTLSSGAIAGNSDAKKIIAKVQKHLPTLVLPQLGVDTSLFHPAISKDSRTQKTIAYIGRLVDEKGVMTLLKAFESLANHYASWNLLFVGAGTAEKELIDHVLYKKLLDRVEFHPPVSHEKIALLLQTIDILVLPSLDTPLWREQFGHILIEAMACKVCIIGSDAGEIPFVIDDAGLIFKQGNVHSLKETLEKVMSNTSLRCRLAEKGLQRTHKMYTHASIAEKTYDFWRDLSENKKEKVS